jgi:hypothetical protein
MLLQKAAPAGISDLDRCRRRIRDVREEDRAEDTIRFLLRVGHLPRIPQERLDLIKDRSDLRVGRDVAFERKLDEACAWNSFGQIAALFHRDPAVIGVVQYEGRDANRRQHRTQVGFEG